MNIVKKLLIFVLLLGILIFSGCASEPSDTLSVWLISKSTQTEFWQSAFAGAHAAEAEYNLDLTIYGPETEEDYEAQNKQIEQAVNSGADAIVISAISFTHNAQALDRAVESGVKVVVIDSDVNSEKVTVRIGTDNMEAGRIACRSVLNTDQNELIVGIINFDTGVRNGQEREVGFRQALYQDPRVSKIHTINVPAAAEDAREQTIELLSAHPEINVIASFNEPLTVGAARAIDELKAQDRVRLIGFDSNPECIDYMQTGIVSALVVQNPYAMGYLGVECACKILNGENSFLGRSLITPALLVDRETMFLPEYQRVLFPFG